MKALLGTLAAAVAILALMALAGIAWQYHHNSQLRNSNALLELQLEQSRETAATLTAENQALSDQLTELQAMEADLRARVDVLEKDAETAAKQLPEPYRVRAFVGQENVGGAWIVPHNVRMDSELGRYVYEPVLMIDDTAKKHFTVHHTNVVEREVYSTQIYNQGYRYPYYYYVTPRYPHKPVHPPGKPEQPLPPGEVNPPPVNEAAINAQVFAPPASIVNTRPQVIGTPATSPINARVFAP